MGDGSGLAEAMLGLDGVRITNVSEADGEVTIEVETTETRAWCSTCGSRAESQDRMWVDVRDLECFGRPTRLRIWKRRWRCREPLCSARPWTEPLEFLDAQVVLTRRTGAEACRRPTSSRLTTRRVRSCTTNALSVSDSNWEPSPACDALKMFKPSPLDTAHSRQGHRADRYPLESDTPYL